MIIELISVGTAVDSDNLLTYPIFADGTLDTNCDVPLRECDTNWFAHLDDEDFGIVEHLLFN